MYKPHEVLREKESELVRLRREIEALKLIIPLLTTEADETPEADNVPGAGDALSPAAQPGPEVQFDADPQEARARNLIAKSLEDVQSLAERLRKKWGRVKGE